MVTCLCVVLYAKRELTLFKCTEAQCNRLADWIQAAVNAHTVHLLQTSAVELTGLEAWSDEPDVDECDVGELTTPFHGDADTAAGGHDGVAERLAAGEAFVGVLPHASHGVVALGLGEDILEGDLEMVIDVVGVAVIKIDVSHDDVCVVQLEQGTMLLLDGPSWND